MYSVSKIMIFCAIFAIAVLYFKINKIQEKRVYRNIVPVNYNG